MNSLLFFTVMHLLMVNEGFKADPYKIQGIWHIGYGYNLEARMPDLDNYTSMKWTKGYAFYRLEADVRLIDRRLRTRYSCYKRLPMKAKVVLIDMAYNMGIGGLMEFEELLAALCVQDYTAAEEAILDSEYVDDVPTRAAKNIKILKEGI